MRLLIIYAFCTFGGVERVILNRIEAYRKYSIDVKIDLVYLNDAGGYNSFKDYINSFNLSRYINVYILNDDFLRLRINDYDMIINIDTPSVFDYLRECQEFYVECHTGYKDNRKYLSLLPDNVKALLVPSESFRREIREEVPNSKEIYVLHNTVSEIFFNITDTPQKVFFKKRPIAYLSRLDELKNIDEALEVFKAFRDRDDIMYIFIGRGVLNEGFAARLKETGLIKKSFLRTKIHFDKFPQFLKLLRDHRGILFSPSRSESFGMTVAESIVASLPVCVSDIPSHRDLLGSNTDFLYAIGDVKKAKEKIDDILDNWDFYSKTIKTYAEPLRHKSFIESWKRLVS